MGKAGNKEKGGHKNTSKRWDWWGEKWQDLGQKQSIVTVAKAGYMMIHNGGHQAGV